MTKRRNREQLSRQEIGAAALLLVDEQGDAALTMRRLATQLHCDPMTLYRYVDGRHDLLTLVASTVIGSIAVPDASLDDRPWLVELSRRLRTTLCEHRNVMPIIGNALVPIGLHSEVIIVLAQRLAGNTNTGHSLLDRYNMFVGGIVGYLTLELTTVPSEPTSRVSSESPQLPKKINSLKGKAFGFRDPTDPVLLPNGFRLITETLINAVLDPILDLRTI